jgi:hypothetical protein
MDDGRKKRDDEREKKQRFMLLLLGFACLIQLFVSVQQSREIAGRWGRQREDESRAFERRVRDEGGGPAPAEAAK